MAATEAVLAVCVNYNGAAVLPATLATLDKTEGVGLETVVVDCSSTDGSADELPGGVRLLRLARNEGYAAGLNAGVKWGLEERRHEWFLLLNNDIELEPGAVRKLLESGRRRGTGVFGPLVLSHADPRRLDYAWGEIVGGHALARFHGQGAPASDPCWHEERAVELLLGCALLVHREVFDRVGLFDPAFFMYHEEVDFLFRCRQAGVAVVFCPSAVVRHHSGWSTRGRPLQKVFWTRRNSVLFLRKHGASMRQWAYYWLTLAGSLCKHLLLLRWRHVNATVRGVAEGLAAR